MSFSQHLVLWLHVAFAVFTIGPLVLVISSTPRYIRRGEVNVVRYLSRITFIFMLGSVGVLIAGIVLAQMLNESGKVYLIVSETLFLVAIVLLLLIIRDQRLAIRALTAEADQPAAPQAAGPEAEGERLLGEDDPDAGDPAPQTAARQLATVERGRIAMLGGVVSLIYLVILVMMIFNN